MKKAILFLAIVTVSAEGMNNGLTPNSQPNANGRIMRILAISSTSEGRPNDGRNAFITPPTSPQSGSNINRVVTPFNLEGRSNSNGLTTIYENQPHSNTMVSQNRFITTQNAMPISQSLNEQNPNFFGRRMQSQSYTTRSSMVMPHQPNIQNYAGQISQFISNTIPIRQSIFNQQIRPGNNRNILRTHISLYITTYVETVPQVPQYMGTYPNNFAQNFKLQPQNQFSQNSTQQPQEYRRTGRKRKASGDAETLTVKKAEISGKNSSEKDMRHFSNSQSQSELIPDSATQNNDSKKGWLETLYNSLIQPDHSEASTSHVEDSVNEIEPSGDEHDNMPLSQIRNLKKRKSSSSDARHLAKKRK